MKGHENVILLRKAGKRPAFVFVNDWPCNTDWFETGEHATVCTAGDRLESIDLRFLVGLRVSVSSNSESRAKALFNACKAAGVEMVGAVHVKPDRRPWDQDGWVEVWKSETVDA